MIYIWLFDVGRNFDKIDIVWILLIKIIFKYVVIIMDKVGLKTKTILEVYATRIKWKLINEIF